jgi:hypothetical protein
MLTIWKFKLDVTREQFIDIPMNHKFLHVSVVGEDVFAWAEVRSDSPKTKAKIIMYGTGFDIHGPHERRSYIGTAVDVACGYVWHFYSEK